MNSTDDRSPRWLRCPTAVLSLMLLLSCGGQGPEGVAEVRAPDVIGPTVVNTMTSNMYYAAAPATPNECAMLSAGNVDPYSGVPSVMLPTNRTPKVVLSMPLHDLADGENVTASYSVEWTNDLQQWNVNGIKIYPTATAYSKLVVADSPTNTEGTTVSSWQWRYFSTNKEHHQVANDRVAFRASAPSPRRDFYLNVVAYGDGPVFDCIVRDCNSAQLCTPRWDARAKEPLCTTDAQVAEPTNPDVALPRERSSSANRDIIRRKPYMHATDTGTPVPCQLTTDLTNSSMHLVRHRVEPFLPVLPSCKAGASGSSYGLTCNWQMDDGIDDDWPESLPKTFNHVNHQIFPKAAVTWTSPSAVQTTTATTIPPFANPAFKVGDGPEMKYLSTADLPVMWVELPDWVVGQDVTIEADSSLFGNIYAGLAQSSACNLEYHTMLRLTANGDDPVTPGKDPTGGYMGATGSFNLSDQMKGWTQEHTGMVQVAPNGWTVPPASDGWSTVRKYKYVTLYAGMGNFQSKDCKSTPIAIEPNRGSLSVLIHYRSSVGMRTAVSVALPFADTRVFSAQKTLGTLSVKACAGGFVRAFGTNLVGDPINGQYGSFSGQIRATMADGSPAWMGAWRWFDMGAEGSYYGVTAALGQLSIGQTQSLQVSVKGTSPTGTLTALGGGNARLSAISYDFGGGCLGPNATN